MVAVKSPLGTIGALLFVLEAVAVGALVALDSDPGLRAWVTAAIIFVLVLTTVVVLGVYVFLAIRKPAYLFSPSDISQEAHIQLYGHGPVLSTSTPPAEVELDPSNLLSILGSTTEDSNAPDE